jgi:putative nucleotide binding protein
MENREEKALILDFLPNGYPMEMRRSPLAQAMGLNHFTLLELVPRKGTQLQLREEVYIGEGKRDKIEFIRGRLPKQKLTETAKLQLKDLIGNIVDMKEETFVEFFNNAGAVSTRLHQLELLPGLGKKHTQAIIEEREKEKFKSFEDIKDRVKNVPDPKKIIEKRLMEELIEEVRHRLFVA